MESQPAMNRSKHIDQTSPVSVSNAILKRIVTTTDRDVTELPPIYDAIDPDALEALIDSCTTSTASVTFHYHGFRVTVTGDRTVTLTADYDPDEKGELSDTGL